MRNPRLVGVAFLAAAALGNLSAIGGGPGGVTNRGSRPCGDDRGTSSRFQRSSH